MKKLSLKTVDKNTWVRTLVLLIALINQGMIIFGNETQPVDTDKLAYYFSFAATAISSVWSWWKNNSFTLSAQQADNYMNGEPDSQG